MLHPSLASTLFRTAVVTVFLTGYAGLATTALAATTTPTAPVKQKRASSASGASSVSSATSTTTGAPGAIAPIDFPSIVERYGAAVVNISAAAPEGKTSSPDTEAIDSDDPLAGFFKRNSVPQPPDPSDAQPRAISGSGSGFIISPDGLILTTAHVVDQSDDITVRLTDRREFKAKVLTVDAQSDIALIKIDATKLPTVRLGDSSKVRVGDQVLTIGSPDRFQNTVTAGLVSATSRTLADGSTFPFFQTDVALNPDNSGGPLFNKAGEVVGIDVQVYAGSGRLQSLTFAIPINLANQVRTQLQSQSAISGSGLGMQVQDVDPNLAGAFGLPKAAGALVIMVEPGTPAAASGLKPADVIVQIGEKAIDRSTDLSEYALQPGTKVTLKLFRNRRPMTTTMAVGNGEAGGSGGSAPPGQASGARQSDASAAERMGLAMHPLTDAERRSSGLPQGLMVDDVGGAAARAGIQPGDIVLSLNGTMVETQDDLSALAAKSGRKVALLIQRDNARSFVTVDMR